ncbi:MAG: hypothetical protein JKY81_01055 [Colwellia sp.]|nr:hypothetical protein [Colwellia sp.]
MLSVFLSACSSSQVSDKTTTIEQELLQTLVNTTHMNTSKIHLLTKQLVQEQHWQKVFLGYQWLCLHTINNPNNYCTLMWSSAKQSNNDDILFEAAATSYAFNKSSYWLQQSQRYAKSTAQQLILKTLQDIPLTNPQLSELINYPKHYAQALFLKGKLESDIALLHQAQAIFLQNKNWQKLGDVLLLSAKIILSNQNHSKASNYFHEAILYYDLANANNKLEFAINWGKVHGITR